MTSQGPLFPYRIISGGQTGVDRAALDAAKAMNWPCGGWCPLGRTSESGPIPASYPLRETSSPQYAARTRMNVRDSNATLILSWGSPAGGTARTIEFAHSLRRPFLLVDLTTTPIDQAPQPILEWLARFRPETLNVAGPRESEHPGIHSQVFSLLMSLFSAAAAGNPPPVPPEWPPRRPRTPSFQEGTPITGDTHVS